MRPCEKSPCLYSAEECIQTPPESLHYTSYKMLIFGVMNGSFNVTETSFFLFMIVLIDLVQNYSVLKLNM